ncbi:MAG: hypothetical protein GTO30_15125, partial [Acidobacteria bacterium]|nr:hypothetical protein [Acidobacteriota bacterium]NIM62921.1 hypothetical protein [Acidobacteriota bacterium]NIO60786.1 hypothetical protein [Acidobacteriota bacterium]NIQ87201.1 hypothetical protein [Acidobacteriota bacterium]NIT12452.1 hypothetical protein [Acidobacteriota bacterium]
LLTGDPDFNRELMDGGHLPWWTPPRFRIAFFRYLSTLTMWVDYRLWPESAWLMHAQSLLWFAALVVAVVLFYRRMFGGGMVAGLAALLYAVDEARAVPAIWLSNRNALLATLFAVLCLWAHDRWRRDAWRPGAALGPLFLALALGSAELGLGAVAYLVAHAVFLEPGPWRRRLVALAPHGAVVAAWIVLYRVLGYGVVGSGLYLDPVNDLAGYARLFPDRFVYQLLGQWTAIPADLAAYVTADVQRVLWLLGLGTIAVVAWALTPLLRRDALARFWMLGMLLSLVPVAATFASNRLLMCAGLGGMGLLAQFLVAAFPRADSLARTRLSRQAVRVLSWLLIVTHLGIAPLGLALAFAGVQNMGRAQIEAAASIPHPPRIAQQDLVILHSPDYLFFVAPIAALKHFDGHPYARSMRPLATTPVPLVVTRVDERTLDVRMEGGLFAGPLGRLFRGWRDPLRAGDRVELDGWTVTVLDAAADGDVLEARFEFAVPLEDPSLHWVRWEDHGYVPFSPPPVGRSIRVPAARSLLEQYR